MKFRLILKVSTWYGFWLLAVIALYWSVLPALPYRDHPVLMLGRQLAESDWQWFWSMLSYNRTRILLPGDYFAFRPLHLAIVALQDIFLRYHLTAQGIVNCMQFAFAATIFCSLAKRLVGVFAALALTFLWIAVPAGSAIVMWHHISPYILCPALFMASLRFLDADDLGLSSKAQEIMAASCVCAACLTHESGVLTALSVSALVILFGNRCMPCKRRLLIVFLLPAVVALFINGADYFVIHPPPSLTGTADKLSSQTTIVDIISFLGAIGAAFLASPALHLAQMADGFPEWVFTTEKTLLLNSMAVVIATLLILVVIVTFNEVRRKGVTRLALLLAVFASFFLATFAACTFRMYSRDVFYMAQATYYYSLFSLTLGCFAVGLLSVVKNKYTRNAIIVLIILIGITHVISLHKYLKFTEPLRKSIYSVIMEGRKAISTNSDICYNGSLEASLSGLTMDPFFYDISCEKRPKAFPLYLTSENNGQVWLSSLENIHPETKMIPVIIPPAQQLPGKAGWAISMEIDYSYDIQFSTNNVGKISIILTNQTGIQQAFVIERNLLKKVVWPNQMMYYGSLFKDVAASIITYKLGFTQDAIVLFADGRLIGELPAAPLGTTSLNLVLHTTDNKKFNIRNMYISEQPSLNSLQLIHRYKLINL